MARSPDPVGAPSPRLRIPIPLILTLVRSVSIPSKITDWLETRWIAPAYVGWVLMGLAAFFFAAATNTLAGWLYVMSGVLLAMLAIAAILPPRNLAHIEIERQPIRPVTAGESLLVELTLTNRTRQAKALLQVGEELPKALGGRQETAIAAIGPGGIHRWIYEVPTQRRGLYHWQDVFLRTAAPLGLFWCRRPHTVPAVATVYPQILPLSRCSLIDAIGEDTGQEWQQIQHARLANEGITRALRPYRWGDPTRLIHWRTSARYGELRVRELEKIVAGQQVIIALNTADTWDSEAFEQAVVATASLYVYALKQGFMSSLWTPENGLQREKTAILTTLAAITPTPSHPTPSTFPERPLIWLTQHPVKATTLPPTSCQLAWQSSPTQGEGAGNGAGPVIWINPEESLQTQLQALHR